MNQSCNPVIISDTAWHLQTEPKSPGSATAAWTHHKLFPLQDVDELKFDRELLFRDVEHRAQLMNSDNQLSMDAMLQSITTVNTGAPRSQKRDACKACSAVRPS